MPARLPSQCAILRQELRLSGSTESIVQQAAEQLGEVVDGRTPEETAVACLEQLGYVAAAATPVAEAFSIEDAPRGPMPATLQDAPRGTMPTADAE